MNKLEILNKLKEESTSVKEDFINQIKEREEQKRQLFSNYDYIDWLIEFTKKYDKFIVDDFEYNYFKLSDRDRENLGKFNIFMEGIIDYANKNYIYPINEEFGAYYVIKTGSIAFQLGYDLGQGSYGYCERTKNTSQAIEFNDIMDGKLLPRAERITKKLSKLSDEIEELQKLGIPYNCIIAEMNKVNNYTKKKVK